MSHYFRVECRTCPPPDNATWERNHGDAELIAAVENRELLAKVNALLNEWWRICATESLPGAAVFIANHAEHELWLVDEYDRDTRKLCDAC